MGHTQDRIKDWITAERVAIFFGLLSTCLIVALVIVVVHRDNLWLQLDEAKRMLDVLEEYIQSHLLSTISDRNS
ncbi:uncharacterized protein LOC116801419 [Drosophila sechellia]|uniref:uncharacterized protein LOC27208585 n=1 Tax=Drosophila simulans TaxID=7240 RepID=UPI00078AE2AA|nr:uncharacterized protein LOC27208585 [Drosophila simulans]XP_032576668.1 uncharacterized protein LOC116801419 [Drosophila sechellia]KMZ03835.1 uncharacterized protein Dsimw501_GD28740 [Drosophila simulans]